MKKILIAYDGSDPANKAVVVGIDLAQRYQAEVQVLTVAQTPEIGSDVETEAIIEYARSRHATLLHDLKRRLGQTAASLHMELAVGHPVQQILNNAEQRNIDLIVLGHSGKGALDRWRLGSVTHRVISYAHCAVMVIR
jgi:nucleotide-binding universal stress UspA family protein